MGLDIHGLNLLRHARRHGAFQRCITIGRQGVHVDKMSLRTLLGAAPGYAPGTYCESLLQEHFGASSVDSIDNSNFESATIVHDMNQPIPAALAAGYDTVFDGGCLEHIYNVTQALANCSAFCKPGAQILHVLPANNFCGHGFWQFSPELFFALYAPGNGYRDTEVFLADLEDTEHWYRVKMPENDQRVNVINAHELYLLVRTVVAGATVSHRAVQQSDYAYAWAQSAQAAAPAGAVEPTAHPLKAALGPIADGLRALKRRLRPYLRPYRRPPHSGLDGNNPGLTRVKVSALLAG